MIFSKGDKERLFARNNIYIGTGRIWGRQEMIEENTPYWMNRMTSSTKLGRRTLTTQMLELKRMRNKWKRNDSEA